MYVIEMETWQQHYGPFIKKARAEAFLAREGFRQSSLDLWIKEGERIGETEFAHVHELISPNHEA